MLLSVAAVLLGASARLTEAEALSARLDSLVINTLGALRQAESTCSLYEISGDTCGQSDLDCKYKKYAKLAERGLDDGTCPDHGYSVQTSTTTKSYPVIGSITITEYKMA